MVKISRNSMIFTRVQKLRRTIHIDTQRMRERALKNLEELFDLAKSQAQNGNCTLPQRQRWIQVAGYIAQVINSVATGFDERGIDVQLDELEKLVSEAKAKAKGKIKESEGSAASTRTAPNS